MNKVDAFMTGLACGVFLLGLAIIYKDVGWL